MKVTRETNNYKWTTLFKTELFRIVFVECKYDNNFDNIKFIRMGTETLEPEKIVIYRWEDEELINDILKRYGAE